MINIKEITRLREIIKRSEQNELMAFMSNHEIDLLEQMRKENLQILFKEARKFKVRYIYVGKGEIAGCEDKRQPGGTWPAMWAICDNVGFPSSCGNSDQHQALGSEYVFPEDSYGGWDLTENRKLSNEETEKKKFKRVVTSDWAKKR